MVWEGKNLLVGFPVLVVAFSHPRPQGDTLLERGQDSCLPCVTGHFRGVGGFGAKVGQQNGANDVTYCAFLVCIWNVLQNQTTFNLSAIFLKRGEPEMFIYNI